MAEVAEDVGRAAVERVLAGVTQTQADAGDVPGGAAAERWAQDIAVKQIKRHERGETQKPMPKPAEPAPCRLDRGDVPDDAVIINSTSIDESKTPQALKHMGKAPPLSTLDALMMARIKLLEQFPDWHAKLHAAWVTGEHDAMLSGVELDRIDAKRRASMQADKVLAVLDLSSNVFGDWRTPKTDGPTKLYIVPRY